jgi:hypothetical protein
MAHIASPVALLLLALAPGLALARLPAYDFAGVWVGAIFAAGVREDLTAALASRGTKITGMVTAEGPLGTVHCKARGKRRRTVVLALVCPERTRAKLKGALDVGANTMSGSARLSKRGHHASGTFSLSKLPL